jgi:CubicO group peptidase (beta-lactamase class C family)
VALDVAGQDSDLGSRTSIAYFNAYGGHPAPEHYLIEGRSKNAIRYRPEKRPMPCKRFVTIAGLFLLLFCGNLAAQVSINKLDPAIAAQIDKVFERMNKPDCPGCAMGISRNGEVLYLRGYGMANLEYAVPITSETVFEAGSVSKQFTAAAILLLEKQGKLSLDDDIRKFLPEVPDFGSKITIRNLLSHTSGLRDQWALLTIAGRPPGSAVHTLEEILGLVSRQKELNFQPGAEYLYSNTGFSLLALIVQRVNGKSLAEFSQSEIFKPLGMPGTQWRDDHTRIVKNRATAYAVDKAGAFHTDMPFTRVYGNGGLLTTVADLLTWNEIFFNPRVLDQELIDRMQTAGTLAGGEAIDYGLGLALVEYKGLREISHSGSTAGYRAYLLRFPEQHLSLALLCNVGNANAEALAHQAIAPLLVGQLKERPKPALLKLSEQELQNRAGLYRNPATDSILRLTFADKKLLLEGADVNNELVPIEPQVCETGNGIRYRFESTNNGEPRELRVLPARGKSVLYISAPMANPSPEQLAEYVGSYSSEELEVTYKVGTQEGRLYMQHPPEPALILSPTYLDAFSANESGWQIRFTRDAASKVNGFRIYAGRVLHLRFVRRPT